MLKPTADTRPAYRALRCACAKRQRPKNLLGIWNYVAQDSPSAADRLWQRFSDRFDDLLKNPFIGESQERFRPGLRSIVESNYVVFYEPRPSEILIYRVIHGARKWEDLLPRPID